MNVAATTGSTLMNAVWPAGNESAARTARVVALMVVGTVILAISAKLQVPFWPVPMTLQTFAVLVIGMAYGWRLAGATLALYLLEGSLGLPVFSRPSGITYLFTQPTAGYIWGFFVAAIVVGGLAERGWDRQPLTTAAAMLIGNAIIYLLGVGWLAYWLASSGSVGEGATPLGVALASGLTPFLVGDAVKLALATAILPLAWRLVGRRSI